MISRFLKLLYYDLNVIESKNIKKRKALFFLKIKIGKWEPERWLSR